MTMRVRRLAKTLRERVVLHRLLACAVVNAFLLPVGLWRSRGLECSRPVLKVQALPGGLDGLRVAQITDLHSSRFGPGQAGLVKPIAAFRPDVIVLTGDIIDGVRPEAAPCVELVRALAAVAPVYRIRGNHEYYLEPEARQAFDDAMARSGAILLSNEAVALGRRGERWLLAGMEDGERFAADPRRTEIGEDAFDGEAAADSMAALQAATPPWAYGLRLLLCHRPYYGQLWSDAGYDAALCGHLHGWVLRLPVVGALPYILHPHFPQADCGLYEQGGTQVYISRGLAKTGWNRLRTFNRPELVLAEFRSGDPPPIKENKLH